MKWIGGIWQQHGDFARAIAISTTLAIAAIFVDVYGLHDGWHWGLVLPAGVVVMIGPVGWWRSTRRTSTGKQASS